MLEITDSSLANTGLSWETPEAFRIESITHLNATPFNGFKCRNSLEGSPLISNKYHSNVECRPTLN